MVTDLKKVEHRTIQYWFEDGIWEMAFGGWSFLLGIFTFGFALIPGKPFLRALGWVGLLAVIIICARFAGRAVRLLKEKWTYPRAGFVSYRRPGGQNRPRRFSWVGGLAGLASALVYGLLRDSFGYMWAQAGLSLLMALTFFYTAIRTKLTRFYVLSVFLLAAGILVTRSGLKALSGVGVFCCLLGLALCASGSITFRQFVRKNPVLEKEQS
jgi:hypothetical protein